MVDIAVTGLAPACSTRRMALSCESRLTSPQQSSTTYASYPSVIACTVGSATQVSVHRPDTTIFFLPVFWIAATKLSSSQEFMDERSIGVWPCSAANRTGQVLPLKLLVSTLDSTTGTPNTRAALARRTLLFTID